MGASSQYKTFSVLSRNSRIIIIIIIIIIVIDLFCFIAICQPTTTDFIGTIQLAVTEVVAGPKPNQFTLKAPVTFSKRINFVASKTIV